MTLEQSVTSIPLSAINTTGSNVRTVKASNASDKSLISSIKEKGLIQNLVVYKEGKKYFAVAGGRRLAACKYLVSKKHMSKDHPIPCRIVEKADSTGLSLSENIHRERMHPADEFIAFSKLVAEGNSIKSIAEEYGVTQKDVKQRLALSEVDMKIIQSYKEGEIDLETVMAFTLELDKAKQVEIFDAHKENLKAYVVRNLLTKDSIKSDCKLAKFVGVNEYKKAGGAIVFDMFSDNDHLANPDLLTELAIAKMDKLVNKYIGDGWKWCEYTLEHYMDGNHINLDPDTSLVPKELTTKKEKLEKEKDDLEDKLYYNNEIDLSEEEHEKHEARCEELEDELEELDEKIESHYFFTDEQKTTSGVTLMIGHDGLLRTETGLMRKSDVVKTDLENDGVVKQVEKEGISQALKSELRGYSDQLIQLELIQNPELSGLMYQFELCYSLLSGVDSWKFSNLFNSTHTKQVSWNDEVKDSKGYEALQNEILDVDKTWLKKDVESSYVAFSKLSVKKRAIIFGSVVSMLAADVTTQDSKDSVKSELRKATCFDRSKYWSPTVANYLGRISRIMTEGVANKLLGSKWVKEKGGLKKKQFAVAVFDAFNDQKLSTDKKKVVESWLPDELF